MTVSKRHIGLTGSQLASRRYAASSDNLQQSDVEDPERLTDLLRKSLRRISELESRSPPSTLDFELSIPAAATVFNLQHNFNSPVRWWVVGWRTTGAAVSPVVREEFASSTSNILVLRFNVASTSRAVVRVEQSPFPQANGGT